MTTTRNTGADAPDVGTAKKPAFSVDLPCRGGTVSVAAWENMVGEGDNERLVYMLTLNRSYNDGKEWKETTSMRPEDVPVLQVALSRVYEWTLDQSRQ